MEVRESNARVVLDAHEGKTNIIESEDIDVVMIETLKLLRDILSDYSGPFSKYAILSPQVGVGTEPIFTKDGINIIRAIEFVNLMQNHVKEMISYIGRQVEAAAGDGTTSSMIMVTNTLLELRTYLKDHKVTYTSFRKGYLIFAEKVEGMLNKIAIITKEDTPKEAIAAIAFHQAMTSSHGDTALAELVSEFFSTSDRSAWRNMQYRREARETKELYRFEPKGCDFSTRRASIFSGRMLNEDNCTRYLMTDGTILLYPQQMISNSPLWVPLVERITKAMADDEKLTVVAPSNYDSMVQSKLEELFVNYTGGNVAVLLINESNNPATDPMCALFALRDINLRQNNRTVVEIPGCTVNFKDSLVKFTGISTYVDGRIKGSDDVTTFIGAYLDQMNKFCEIRKTDQDSHAAKETLMARDIYNQVMFQEIGTFIIGGKNYDNAAALDVVEDVFKATLRSLTEGVVLGGFSSLKRALNQIISDNLTTKGEPLETVLAEAFKKGIEFIETSVLRHAGIESLNNLVPAEDLTGNLALTGQVVKFHEHLQSRALGDSIYDVIQGKFVSLEDVLVFEKSVIVQPLATDLAMLNRFGEVALKFLFANRIIVPNSVVTNTPKGK